MADPTRAVRLIDMTGTALPSDLAEEEIQTGVRIADAVGKPWAVDGATGDQYPSVDAGLGRITDPVAHVAVGHQDTESGIEGVIIERTDENGGGIQIIGIRDLDPALPAPDPVVANAPSEIAGDPILLTGRVWVQVDAPITADYEVLAGPSQSTQDGRHFAPLIMGPKKIYQYEETASSPADVDVLTIGGEVEIVALTLVNAYPVEVSVFAFQVQLENLSNKTTAFDVIFKADGIEASREAHALNRNTLFVSGSFPIDAPLIAGQVISLDVEAVGTHAQSQGWVMGSIALTEIQMKHG